MAIDNSANQNDINRLTKAINNLQTSIGSKNTSSTGEKGSWGSSWSGGSPGGGAVDTAAKAATSKSPIIGAIKAGFEGVTGIIRGITNVGSSLYGAGIVQTQDYSQERVFSGKKALEILSQIGKEKGMLKTGLEEIGNQIIFQLQDEAGLRTKINEETGLTGKLSEDVRTSIINSTPAILQMGYDIKRVAEFYTQIIEKSGRFNIINKEVLERTAQVSRAFVGDLSKMAEHMNTYEKVGVGAKDTLEYMNSIGVKSLELGLRSKKTVSDVTDNLEKLNQYGFKNGIQGLAEMSRKATEFRMSMSETFKIAEKVFSPEGAMELSANLQVIGGVLGDFNDPLKLMYMATNNVEGLQTALMGAAQSLATYNAEQGRFEITGINLRRAQAMAKELGVDYNELAKGAISAAERTQAASALMSTGLKMTADDREFITNLSQMEKGEMVIKIPESLAKKIGSPLTVELSQMTDSLRKELIDNKEAFKNMDSKDIAMEQLSVQEKMERNLMAIAAVAKVRLTQILKDTTSPLSDKMEAVAGRLGIAVEDLTKNEGGKLSLLPGAEDFIKKAAVKMGLGDIKGIESANNMLSEYMKTKKANDEAKNVTIENKFTHQYNASPSLLDSLGRHIARSPQTWETIYGAHYQEDGSFLQTNTGNLL